MTPATRAAPVRTCLSARSNRLSLVLCICALCATSTIAASPLSAQQIKANEYQVKATYLYNFGKFVKWPPEVTADKSDSFAVCILGQDPFGTVLDTTLASEKLDGKPVVLRRISQPKDATDCRIVFISSAEDKHLKEILAALDSFGALTVSDMHDFARRGGMIQFTAEGEKIRFEINLGSAESAKLVLSSELLKVAANVRKAAPAGD